MKKAAIAIDEWKLPIFQRQMEQSGYKFTNTGHMAPGSLLLLVETTNLEALYVVLMAANDEAARTGAPQ